MAERQEWWWVRYAGEVQPAEVVLDGDAIEAVWLTGSDMPVRDVELVARLELPAETQPAS